MSNILKVQSLEELWDKYASEATKKELSNELKGTVNAIVDEETNRQEIFKVGYFGMTIKWDSDQELDIDPYAEKLMGLINWGVDEGYLFHGYLMKLSKFNLLGFSKTEPVIMIDQEGMETYFNPDAALEKPVKHVGVYSKRCILIAYVLCKVEKDHFNFEAKKRFGWGSPSTDEGALPEEIVL